MKGRNYGIDFLKSFSMLMIVMLHVLGVGGILAGQGNYPPAGTADWLLETANMCAVNCFGLVSGYVLCRGRYRRSRIVSLWLRVVFESLVVTVLFAVFMPGSTQRHDWICVFTPVLHNIYWYFTAYFALFFFVPYINKMLATLTDREMTLLALSTVFLFTIMQNFANLDLFNLNGGYSFLWLLCLYILGAYLRRTDPGKNIKSFWFLAGYFLCVIIAWALMKFLNNSNMISYVSPFILLAAVFLLLFFRRLPFSPSAPHKFVSMLSRTSFGVYIIHTNPLIWRNLLTDAFTFYRGFPVPITILTVMLTAVAIYAVCTLGDWLVEKLFRLARIDLLEAAIDRIGKNVA